MKKTITKLSLNKSTISNLGNSVMNSKIGGNKTTNLNVCKTTNPATAVLPCIPATLQIGCPQTKKCTK